MGLLSRLLWTVAYATVLLGILAVWTMPSLVPFFIVTTVIFGVSGIGFDLARRGA